MSATETYTGVSLVCNWMGRGGAVGLPGLFVWKQKYISSPLSKYPLNSQAVVWCTLREENLPKRFARERFLLWHWACSTLASAVSIKQLFSDKQETQQGGKSKRTFVKQRRRNSRCNPAFPWGMSIPGAERERPTCRCTDAQMHRCQDADMGGYAVV